MALTMALNLLKRKWLIQVAQGALDKIIKGKIS
jgi:hypothetical protein